MVVEQIGSVSRDGITILYDRDTEQMLEMRIPSVPEGTELEQDKNGQWNIVYPYDMDLTLKKRLEQSEKFYHATKNFLSYKAYLHVTNIFSENCADKFRNNPFFLTDISYTDSDKPICSFQAIDSAVTLSTFDIRLSELKCAIRYVLLLNESQGHTWMPYKMLDKRLRRILMKDGHPLQNGDVSAYLRYFENDFYVEEDENDYNESKIAIRTTYLREYNIYHQIRYANSLPTPFPEYEPPEENELSEDQFEAIKKCISKGGHFSILTGGPGTGKTTTLLTMVDTLQADYPTVNIYLLSPTGRATKRIKEVFGDREMTILTIHKFIGFGHTVTRRELDRIRGADLIIVDESSMLDLDIFEKLITMVDLTKTKIILVGDVDQLPSIGAGNVLSDLISMGVVTSYLKENHRSSGLINQNARAINNGELFLEEDESFSIRPVPVGISDQIAGMDLNNDIIITPYRVEGRYGASETINKIVQKRIFKNAPHLYEAKFHIGDIVIMTHTNYKLGYFNGEMGKIIQRLPSGEFIIDFGDRTANVIDQDDMDLGYAATVHKNQGSEYPHIIICIPEYNSFITRRMLYTAVTRARIGIIIYSSPGIIRRIIMNNPEINRRTFLNSYPKLCVTA